MNTWKKHATTTQDAIKSTKSAPTKCLSLSCVYMQECNKDKYSGSRLLLFTLFIGFSISIFSFFVLKDTRLLVDSSTRRLLGLVYLV